MSGTGQPVDGVEAEPTEETTTEEDGAAQDAEQPVDENETRWRGVKKSMILNLEHIYKDYQQDKLVVPVLKDVCLQVEEG